MKTLTLHQPWASLVVGGEKTIETRSWNSHYRGPLLIHAAKNFPEEAEALCRTGPFEAALRRMGYGGLAFLDLAKALPRGAVIGGARLHAVIPVGDVSPYPNEEAFGDYTEGRFAWVLSDAYRFDEPVAARGQLGLWDYPPGASA